MKKPTEEDDDKQTNKQTTNKEYGNVWVPRRLTAAAIEWNCLYINAFAEVEHWRADCCVSVHGQGQLTSQEKLLGTPSWLQQELHINIEFQRHLWRVREELPTETKKLKRESTLEVSALSNLLIMTKRLKLKTKETMKFRLPDSRHSRFYRSSDCNRTE